MAIDTLYHAIRDRLTTADTTMSEKPRTRRSWRDVIKRSSSESNVQPSETAWLDGLRGVAAFLVMMFHFHLDFFDATNLEEPFGASAEAMDFWRLPFIRLYMCSGHVQVSIFFVLSGFVLSWSSLASIRSGQTEKNAKSLSSAVFRRWLRLYLPCFAIATIYCFLFYFHFIDMGGKERESNVFLQLWDLAKANAKFANLWNIDRNLWTSLHPYEGTMWSIPMEFAGSLLVFLTLLACTQLREYKRRTIVTIGISLYALADARWSYWLFASGLCIADYVRMRGGFRNIVHSQSTVARIAWSFVFILGLYIAGYPPPNASHLTGYTLMSWLTPPQWKDVEGGGGFWWCVAAILILLSASHLRGIQRFFELSVSRFLGRISFMLYLIHRACLMTIGSQLRGFIFPKFGFGLHMGVYGTGVFANLVVYLFIMSLLIPSTLLAAFVLYHAIDQPSVRFAKSVEGWFLAGNERSAAPTTDMSHIVAAEEGVYLLGHDLDSSSSQSGSEERGSESRSRSPDSQR